MCDICEGRATQLEILERVEQRRIEIGWYAIAVSGIDGVPRPWTYTIGLTQTWGAPELVMVGACGHCAKQTFDQLVLDRIATSWGCDPPAEVRVGDQRLGIVPVHPSQWATDRFTMWLEHRLCFPHDAPQRAVQLLFADEDHVLPTEPGVDPTVRRAQTRLDRAIVRDRQPARGHTRRRRR